MNHSANCDGQGMMVWEIISRKELGGKAEDGYK
jgi:hypothetical protein